MAAPSKTPSEMLVIVAAALADADGRVLVQQRAPDRPMAGLWEFPGGKIEPGETAIAALVRELHEELGVTVDHADLTPTGFGTAQLENGRELLLLLYLCQSWQGTPQALDATALRWLYPAQLRTLPMPPADLPLIGLLENLVRQPEPNTAAPR